ncbi:UDP-glucose 4-epimerase [Angomonas deanei]|uniref:NAD-dependent epimerase/dehydratase domain-containing protein n=1 Tax=Angomonas deanei TaxID=59799 RepID=A0A7G2CS48_9TRYP|nr:UDP-glucose 4-epimerase [Angomonas deanei]CAD2221821.1 NAD dependent epimerase/dehydratase family/Polysaccharide biosynthesis protein/3-beta hydroxysteroid dehydrogenase/isomerase family/GDP-mannose 4,6 dehydratase/Male sterility protein/RmlD substrate binding domain containing protein, putative [Angomonas deanei]|eukprot:EPY34576.1 UDP-glucose 4-epimerase [Angomonas deanei]
MMADHNKSPASDKLKVELRVGDLRDPKFVESFFSEFKIDSIIHFAAHSCVAESTVNSMKYYNNNLTGVMNLLNAMSQHGCKNFVFSSTAAVYGEGGQDEAKTKQGDYALLKENTFLQPKNPYGRSKLSCEWIISDQVNSFNRTASETDKRQINGMCLRYFNACGCDRKYGETHDPETHLIPILLRVFLSKKINHFLDHVLQSDKKEVVEYLAQHGGLAEAVQQATRQRDYFTVFGSDYPTLDGSAVRDYIHVRDLSIAHILALKYMNDTDKDGQSSFNAFNLGTSKGYSVLEVVKAAQEVVAADYDSTAHNAFFDREVEVRNVDRREGDPPVLVADATLAKSVLGWKLQVPAEYGEYDPNSSESYLRYIISSAWNFHKEHPFNYNEQLNELFDRFYQK